jgi:HK97 gp10 family phage protein
MIRIGMKIEIDPLPKIAGLKQAMQNRIVRKAITTAGKPIVQTAKSQVVQRIGALKFALALKVKTKNNVSFGLIGAKSKYQKAKKGVFAWPVKYAHIVEKGSKFNRARPFLHPAFNPSQVKAQIAELIAQGIREQLAR